MKTYKGIACEIIDQDLDQGGFKIAEIVFLDEGPRADSLLVPWEDVVIAS